MQPNTTGTSTHGWDTVYAVRFPDLNKAIVSHKTSPSSFEQTMTDEGDEYKVSGQFGDWQLAAGGDGKNVHLAVPITKSTLVANHTYECLPITLTIEVNLLWVAARQPGANEDATPHQLQVGNGANAQDNVAIIGVDWGGTKMGEFSRAAYRALLGKWLAEHVGAFSQVFSTIDLNRELSEDAKGLQWLMPTGKPMYAVVDKDGSVEQSIFGVLCMTENRPEPGNHQIDPFAIPADANSGFLINSERVLTNMILPGIPHLFVGSPSVNDFAFSPDGLSLSNKTTMKFADQRLENGSIVYPLIDGGNFQLTMMGSQMHMAMNGLHFEYSPGIKVTINHTSEVTLKLNEKRQFKMDLLGPANTSANISTEGWVIAAEIIGSIAASVLLAAIGGAIGGAVSGGGAAVAEGGTTAAVRTITVVAKESVGEALTNIGQGAFRAAASTLKGGAGEIGSLLSSNWAKILGQVIGGSIGGSLAATSLIINAIANEQAHEVPTLDQFGTQALAPILWPNTEAKGFKLVSGALNGALQIGINLDYKHN